MWVYSIRQVKIVLVLAAVIIAVASLIVSQVLVSDLKEEEHTRMEIWAEAMRSLNNADETTDLSLVLSVLNSNNTIPVIVIGKDGKVQTFRNIEINAKNEADSTSFLASTAKYLENAGRVIKIYLSGSPSEPGDFPEEGASETTETVSSEAGEDAINVKEASAAGVDAGNGKDASAASLATADAGDYINVCYDDSLMLRRLQSYPYVQLGVVMLFVVIAIFALLTSKRAEQNKVWVGLSKETAHQLGTPISSLMAWQEVLKETYPDDELIPEMDKDIKRLQLIADRFSKIGSLPELEPSSINSVMSHVVEYMNRRTSNKVEMIYDFPEEDIMVNINPQLFEWVIENLCKNAVDAMEGVGTITLRIRRENSNCAIEVSDTGKGIRRKDISNVFKPGFTTKKRGWGLGLSLAKRIIEEYHKGKIYVKESEVGKGTTFRIICQVAE